jgi:hypothetical protein
VATLLGATVLGVLLGEVVFQILPGHRLENPDPATIAAAAIPAIGGLLVGGAGWGVLMGRISRVGEDRRMALAGLLGFAPATLAMAFILLNVEAAVAEALEASLPVHRLFTIVFTLCAFSIAAIGTWAIGRGLRRPGLGLRLPLYVGLGSAAAFLVVNLTMEAAGWVVGAPRAAERATMLTVMFSGMLGAGLIGGGLLGRALAQGPSIHSSSLTSAPPPG